MKKLLLAIFLTINLLNFCFAFDLSECYKIFPKEPDNLFIIALSSLNTGGFEILEFQTKNGYILFRANNGFYLLTLTKKYKNQTEIKILPQNSDFTKGSSVAQSVFALIQTKLNTPVEPK